MNFEESNSFVEEMERTNKKKKNVLAVIIACAILVVILFGLISYLKYQDSLKLKMFIDGNQINISSTLLLESDGKKYMSIKELANMLGYSYKNGEYKSYNEDPNSCNFSTDYEVVSLSADSNTFTKYILDKNSLVNIAGLEDEEALQSQLFFMDNTTGQQNINIEVASENESQETFSISEPIKNINNELYVSFDELPRVFNVQLDVSNPNRIRVYSLNNLIISGSQNAEKLGYSQISNIYENLTAIADNMLIVGDGTNYGVVSLVNGQEIVSLKY